MRPAATLLTALALAAAAVAGPPFSSSADADPPKPDRTRVAAASDTWLTLVTGDRVRVRRQPGHPEQVTFVPGRGSGSTGAYTARTGGHTLIIPLTAMPEVASGRLDSSLFDVTLLMSQRYDDKSSATMPVIVRYAGTAQTARTRAAQDRPAGSARSRVLTSLGARGVAVTKTSAAAFWRSATIADARRQLKVEPAIRSITLDRRVRANTDRSVAQIGAPAAWQRGFTGQGVKVAVLDTGIDTGHPDLAGKVTVSANFSYSDDTADHVGHGTHVAGTIAGSGAASDGKYRGVAPDATLLNGKVLDDYGYGTESGIIAGMEWAVAQGADVVNMSLGGEPTDGTDPMSEAVNTLSRSGALFVVAAGNCYETAGQPEQISAPAAAGAALAVGNLERDGVAHEGSCRGGRKGDLAVKPEISAPGTGIVAARAGGTDIGEPVGDHYTTLTGTSMAAPHVAGTAALLAQARPEWTGGQLKQRLISTADPQGSQPVTDIGTGRVDADQATDGSVSVDQAVLDYGFMKWPHPDQQLITKRLTYRNPGAAAVTLSLSAAMDGDSPPVKLSAAELVVPAGGQATVDATIDPTAGGYGGHTGRIVAIPTGGKALVTALGWAFEAEHYDLTIRGVNRDGSPADGLVLVGRPDGKDVPSADGIPMVGGVATVRIEPGVVDLSTFLVQPASDTSPIKLSLVTKPQLTVAANTTATLDARTAKPAPVRVSGVPGLTPRYSVMRYYRTTSTGAPTALYSAHVDPGIEFYAAPSEAVTVGDMEYRVGGRLEVPPFLARSLGDDGSALEVGDATGGARFTGIRDLVAVDAGTGEPGDLRDVRGKLAVIRNDPFTTYPDEIVKAAQDAGAAAVLMFNPNQAGILAALPFGVFPGGTTVPLMRTPRADAVELLELMARRTVTVRVIGVQSTPVVYDLLAPTRGRVPASPGHTADTSRLARVDETFGAHVQGLPIRDDRIPLSTLEPDFIFAPLSIYPLLPTPMRRTSFLSAAPIRWTQNVVQTDNVFRPDEPPFDNEFTTSFQSYRSGSRDRIEWFRPIANSGIPDAATSNSGIRRRPGLFGEGNYLATCLSPIDNGPDHEQFLNVEGGTLTIKRNGEQLGDPGWYCQYLDVPADAADYEISLDTRRSDEYWKYSTRVRSTWTFRAAGGEDEVMPVILADLAVPAASILGQVRTGDPATITLALRHQHGSAAKAKAFALSRLEMSYDGTQWTEVPLRSTGTNTFAATVTHPADRAGQAPHLRVTARDAAGGSLVQQIDHAYGLVAGS